MKMAPSSTGSEPIALIGSSCRLPGGINSSSQLWEFLQEPHDLLVELPPSRFNPRGFYNHNAEHHGVSSL